MLPALALALATDYVPADKNGDDMIQRDEATGGLERYFNRVDKNSDGVVTAKEMNRDIIPPTIS